MTTLTPDQLSLYFKRIGGVANRTPSESLLRELVWKHALHIPFDALAIHFGEKPRVETIDAIFDKLVTRHRGGWCYEMNGLFFYVLKSLGFEVAFHLASVFEKTWRPPTHALLTTQIGDRIFLTDVGFGNLALSEPIELTPDSGIKVMPHGLHYQLTQTAPNEYLYSAGFDDDLRPQYRFSLSGKPLSLEDFVQHNEFFSSQKESPFTQDAVIKIVTPNGFRKLINHQLTEYENIQGKLQSTHKQILETDEDYRKILKEKFGVTIPQHLQPSSPLTGNVPAIQFSLK